MGDKTKLASISRVHFLLCLPVSDGPLMLRRLSPNPLSLNGRLTQTDVDYPLTSGSTVIFADPSDLSDLLTFRVRLVPRPMQPYVLRTASSASSSPEDPP